MAHKSKRPCAIISCNNLTTKAYCDQHDFNQRGVYDKNYNQYQRDKQTDSFYKSRGWQRLRRLAFERDKGLCQRCLKQEILKRADVVHHIVEVKEDWNKRLELSNLESLCHRCHNAIHKQIPPG